MNAPKRETRWIFLTGGVISSLGKGLAASALGACLKASGFSVRLKKLDPYLNVDPGTMSPSEHGEVFVTADGAETDLDLGHYERFTSMDSQAADSITTGKIYRDVIQKEREGAYLGKTVQVIPHITDAIKELLKRDVGAIDFIICEIGGTVGDIESFPFLESIRQMRNDWGAKKTIFIHVTWVPYIALVGECKTKPAQHSVKALLHAGIQPDVLLCRCERALEKIDREKLALFCNVPPQRVIEGRDVSTIYQTPITYHEAGLTEQVFDFFQINPNQKTDLGCWKSLTQKILAPQGRVSIALIGKYTSHRDAYKSLVEALIHGGLSCHTGIDLKWIDAEDFENAESELETTQLLKNIHGVIVPGGFGARGTLGKITAIRWAREHQVPFFGICLGMQLAAIESVRHIGHLCDATSAEFEPKSQKLNLVAPNTHPTHDQALPHMRLGSYACHIHPGTRAYDIYGSDCVFERHRHRYSINPFYEEALKGTGLIFSSRCPQNTLVEIIERPDHPWFMGVQFHPEFQSRPLKPHPLFSSFVRASLQR